MSDSRTLSTGFGTSMENWEEELEGCGPLEFQEWGVVVIELDSSSRWTSESSWTSKASPLACKSFICSNSRKKSGPAQMSDFFNRRASWFCCVWEGDDGTRSGESRAGEEMPSAEIVVALAFVVGRMVAVEAVENCLTKLPGGGGQWMGCCCSESSVKLLI